MKQALSRKNLWERLPRRAKYCVGMLLGAVPSEYLLGRRFREEFRFVREAQWWPAERSRAYQLKQLRRICTLAYEHTLYYRREFERVGFHPNDLKSIEDLAALPTIDKYTVIDHLDEMCAMPTNSPGVDYISTGGTSGVQLQFYIGADRSAIEYAYLMASWERAGYRLDTPMAVFRGRVVAEDRNGLRHEYNPLLRHHYYSSLHMTDDSMRRYLEHVSTIGPCYLHVYPSSAAMLARFIWRSDSAAPANIRGIIAESENVYPDQRRMVQDVFGCRCFTSYGHTEKLVAAAECESSTDYHVWPTYGYSELLSERGQRIAVPGEQGEIVGTGFINSVVPFIRYRTGDYATYTASRCGSCGRQHEIIRDIRGHRIQEVLVAADGTEISWTALNMHDDTFKAVRQFQFYQDTPGRAVLRLVPGAGLSVEEQTRILRNLGQKFDGRVDLTIEICREIRASPAGKAVFVDQRVPRREAIV